MSALARFTSFDPRFGLARFRLARLARLPFARLGAARDGALRRLARGRRRRLLVRSGLMALGAALLSAAGLCAASGLLASRPASERAFAQGSAPRWLEIRHPLAIYGLAGTEFSKLPASYRARRREPDGAREDVMTFGAPGGASGDATGGVTGGVTGGATGGAKPYLQVSLLRAGAGTAGEAATGGAADPAADPLADDPLADDLARLAGVRGMTLTRVRPAAPMDTRLGRFEAADLLLWDGGASRSCLGFRGGASGDGRGDRPGPALRVAGFACGAPGRPMGRAALACAIDRIDLVSAGEDAALRAVFVAAERRGGGTCLDGSPLAAVGPSGRSPAWLDPDGDLPPLRGLFEATARRR